MPCSSQLFNEANPFSPVAWFRTSHKREVDGVTVKEMSTLSLEPEAEAVQAYVMGSLSLVEQKFRMQSERMSNFGPKMAVMSFAGAS